VLDGPVLVGADPTPAGVRAAEYGWRLALAAGVPCELVHAVPDVGISMIPRPGPARQRDLTQALVRNAYQRLAAALESHIGRRVLAGLSVRVGRPADVLAEAAAERGAAVVVLGTRRASALDRALGGSTAHDAVRLVHAPVLVAGRSVAPPRRIMVAADASPHARATIAAAETFARLSHGELLVLHVLEPGLGSDAVPLAAGLTRYDDEQVALFGRRVWSAVTWPDAHPEYRRGPVLEMIRRAVTEWWPDLLVVGSHGRGWVHRMLLGSVTHRLVSDPPASLLVVPPAEDAAAADAAMLAFNLSPLQAPA
jgi:nucleotide-binding universal stress UspA family protein